MTEPQSTSDLSEWIAAARAYDPDRYLAALLAPRAIRDDVLTLAAFFVEIARIPELVSEPMLGEIRLQWWRDALSGLLTGQPASVASGHPLAVAVLALAERRRLPGGLLHGMIDARSADLGADAFPDAMARDVYLDKTHGAYFRAVAHLAGVAPSAVLDSATAAAGKALGLTIRLRRSGSDRAADLAEARQVYQALLGLLRDLPIAPFLPLATVPAHLRSASRQGADPAAIDISPLRRIWLIWRAHRRRQLPTLAK